LSPSYIQDFSNLPIYDRTVLRRGHLEKLIFSQLGDTFSAFYGTERLLCIN